MKSEDCNGCQFYDVKFGSIQWCDKKHIEIKKIANCLEKKKPGD